MKSYLNYIALATTASVLLSACGDSEDKEKVDPKAPQPTTPQHQEAALKQKFSIPTTEDVTRYCATNVPSIIVKDAKITAIKNEHGVNEAPTANLPVTVELQFSVKQSLYSYAMPETFAEAHKILNPLLNAICKSSATYLAEMGADSAMIDVIGSTEPTPLPENLAQLHDALNSLCKSACYKPEYKADSTYVLTQTFIANKQDDTWELSINNDEANAITAFASLIAEEALPENAPILTEDFIKARQAEIAQKAEEFKTATEAYLSSREESIRNEMLSKQSQLSEAIRKDSEEDRKQQAWQDFCCDTFCKNAEFKGEWKRNKDFDKFDLTISGTEIRGKSLHFYGKLYDVLGFEYEPAQLDIVGRCEFEKDAENCSAVVLYIKGGDYDPDKKTREAFEKNGPVFLLKLDENGNLNGTLTNEEWESSPEKNFNVRFSKAKKHEPTKTDLSNFLSQSPSVDIVSTGLTIELEEGHKSTSTTDIPVTATITFTPKQTLYSYETPVAFSESAAIVTPLLLAVQKPGAECLAEMGVDAGTIAAMGMKENNPLPDNIMLLNDELRVLCKSACYRPVYQIGQNYTVTQKFLASASGNTWEFKPLPGEAKPFTELGTLLPHAALPENAPIIKDTFLQERQLEIAHKAEEIKATVEQYMREREESLRAALLQQRSAQQPEEAAPEQN